MPPSFEQDAIIVNGNLDLDSEFVNKLSESIRTKLCIIQQNKIVKDKIRIQINNPILFEEWTNQCYLKDRWSHGSLFERTVRQFRVVDVHTDNYSGVYLE